MATGLLLSDRLSANAYELPAELDLKVLASLVRSEEIGGWK